MLRLFTRKNEGPFARSLFGVPGFTRDFDGLFRTFADHFMSPSVSYVKEGFGSTFSTKEEDTHFLITAELPGLKEDEITIEADDKGLLISGKKETEIPEGYKALHREIGSVEFSRRFRFPVAVELEKTEATLKNGILQVKVAKAPEVQPRKIDVKIA